MMCKNDDVNESWCWQEKMVLEENRCSKKKWFSRVMTQKEHEEMNLLYLR